MGRAAIRARPGRRPIVFRHAACLWFIGLTAVCGCARDPIGFTEIKRIDEKVTETELERFLRVVKALPDEKLSGLSEVFVRPPEWDLSRTLPVRDLVIEEEQRIDERWTTEWIVRRLPRNGSLELALRREGLTPEQFAGLSLAIGVALARIHLPDTYDLDEILQKGEAALDELRADERPFGSLRPDTMYYVLEKAVWITRIDRAERLMQVPPENIALVRANRKQLETVFPDEFNRDPLADVADLKEEKGLPFEELAESGSDVRIEWSRTEAIVGRDQPDPEFRETAGR